MPGRLGETLQRARRGLRSPAFQTRDGALRRLHALGELGLTETRARARRNQRELLLQRVVLPPIIRVLHPFLVQGGNLGHGTSFARWRANSSSRGGVFWDFLTNTR